MTPADHIAAASQHADEASQAHANPAIQAAIAQAHALTAIALLLERLLTDVLDEDATDDDQPAPEVVTQPLVYTVARVIGGEILH